MDFEELKHYYALSLCDGIGAQRLIALRTYFSNAARAFSASTLELRRIPNLGKLTADQFIASKSESLNIAEQHLATLDSDTTIITFFDENYPSSLRNIYNPPAMLFLRGNPFLLSNEHCIAVIGTRKITDYGKRVVASLGKSFAEKSVTVVSGLAIGVDTVAHRSTFDAGGSTIAVLGSGIDVIYPPSNKGFAAELMASDRGLIVSELPIGTKPDGKNFPSRNRIVSGLSSASVIVESEEQGGSMITARIALDQNRDVFALPGDVDRPMSRGPNLLLTENRAKPFRTADDILRSLGWVDGQNRLESKSRSKVGLSAIEAKLVEILELAGEPIHIDLISDRSGTPTYVALVHLLELEFRDIVQQLPGKHFSTIF